jgi:GNAT superfamily N-acetyltransferase
MIRQASADDLAVIRAIVLEAYTPYVAVIGREPAPMTADYAALVAAGHAWMAEGEGGVVDGVAVFFRRDDHLFLENVAVRDAARGRGLGRRLIAFAEDTARGLGLRAVRLYTNEKMTANLALYPRLGYREIARRTEEGFRRVWFEKRL